MKFTALSKRGRICLCVVVHSPTRSTSNYSAHERHAQRTEIEEIDGRTLNALVVSSFECKWNGNPELWKIVVETFPMVRDGVTHTRCPRANVQVWKYKLAFHNGSQRMKPGPHKAVQDWLGATREV